MDRRHFLVTSITGAFALPLGQQPAASHPVAQPISQQALEALEGACGTQVFDYPTIVREVQERAADVSAVLSRQTPQARQMLRKLLDGKIAVEPVTVDGRRGFRLSGRLNVGRLLRAEVLRAIEATTSDEANSPTVVAPTGFEPVFQP